MAGEIWRFAHATNDAGRASEESLVRLFSTEKVKQLLTRERSHWRKIEALPLFLTGLPEGVERSAPSHDASGMPARSV